MASGRCTGLRPVHGLASLALAALFASPIAIGVTPVTPARTEATVVEDQVPFATCRLSPRLRSMAAASISPNGGVVGRW